MEGKKVYLTDKEEKEEKIYVQRERGKNFDADLLG